MTRRRWFILTGLVTVVFSPLIFALVWRMTAGEGERAYLRRVQAELDATDSGWRLDDLLAARERQLPPDDRNPILVTEAVKGLVPQEYKTWQADKLDWLPAEPNRLPQQVDRDRAAAARLAALTAITQARRLRDLPPPGGLKLTINNDIISTLLPHVSHASDVASLLAFDAAMAAVDGDADLAIASVHASLNAGRAIGDEPFLVSTLNQIESASCAATTLERVLALGEPNEGLPALQAAFAAEAENTHLTVALRGERATLSRLFENLDSGTVNLNTVVPIIAGPNSPAGKSNSLLLWKYKSQLPGDHALFLETYTRYVEISRKPTHEQRPLYKQVPTPPDEPRYLLSRILLPNLDKIIESDFRTRALLRSTVAALACERYRRANGRWPNDLAAIPKDLLPTIPLDPYDGQPLRFLRTADGLIIYSIGPDEKDNNANLTRDKTIKPGEDHGFRLWDVKHRRAAPLPKPLADVVEP